MPDPLPPILVVTREIRDAMTPDEIIERAKAGNQRFREGKRAERDFLLEQRATAAGTRPARYDSSRCVCALTSPGMSATSPRSISAVVRIVRRRSCPTAAMRPPSIATHPSRSGGLLTGSTHRARRVSIGNQVSWSGFSRRAPARVLGAP